MGYVSSDFVLPPRSFSPPPPFSRQFDDMGLRLPSVGDPPDPFLSPFWMEFPPQGDDMGLGKTVQVVAFLSAVLGKQGGAADWAPWVPPLSPAQLQQQQAKLEEGAADGSGPAGGGLVVKPPRPKICLVVVPQTVLKVTPGNV